MCEGFDQVCNEAHDNCFYCGECGDLGCCPGMTFCKIRQLKLLYLVILLQDVMTLTSTAKQATSAIWTHTSVSQLTSVRLTLTAIKMFLEFVTSGMLSTKNASTVP